MPDSPTPNETSSNLPVTSKSSTGRPISRFKPGISGNPAGRPKGSRTAIQELRLAVEQALRETIADDLVAIAEKGVELAKRGNPKLIQFFLELFVSKATPIEVLDNQINKITLNVRTLELGEAPRINIIETTPVIDVPSENIKES